MMRNAKKYYLAVERAQEDFVRACSRIGEQIREELIVPACSKHKMIFLSGNGDFYFEYEEWRIESQDSFKYVSNRPSKEMVLLKSDLTPILDVLNIPIGRIDLVGHFVANVLPKDYQ